MISDSAACRQEPADRSSIDVPFVLVSCDFVKTGGMDRANYALASWLAAQGAEVHAVAHSAAEDLRAATTVAFHRVKKPFSSYFLGEPLLSAAGRRVARSLKSRGARTIVNGGNCTWGDVNWVHYVHAAYTPQNRLGLARSAKHALSHRAFLRRERAAISAARLIIANSQRTRRDLIEHLHLPAERIQVIYYGSDPQRFYPPTTAQRQAARQSLHWDTDRPAAIFIGALGDRRKGFDILFDSWRELCADARWDVNLAVVGAGAELPAWRKRAADAGLEKRIEFLGFRRDVPDLLKACDLLIAPPRYEAYGLGVHEALCCGLPALVSASAGIAERYPANLRDLLLPDNLAPGELAERLRNWRLHREHYQQPLVDFSKSLRKHGWDDMSREIVQCVLSPHATVASGKDSIARSSIAAA